jgi:hypothetical protein
MDFSDYDLQSQQQDLERRKAIVDALAGRTLNPTTGDLIKGLFGNSVDSRYADAKAGLARDQATHQQRIQGQLGNELNSYMASMQGSPSKPAAPFMGGEEGVGPPTPAVAPNPREAIVRAMTSQLPEMQAMGKASMSAFGKPEEFSFHQAGDSLFKENKRTGEVSLAGSAPKANWVDEDRVINGQTVPGQRDTMTKQWLPRAPGGTTVNIDNKGTSEVQKETIPVLKGARDTILSSQQGLDAAKRVMTLIDDPQVLSGFGASKVAGLAALGASMGFNGPESAAKTQALGTEMAKNTLAQTKNLPGAISDKEKPFLEEVSAGRIDFSPQVIKHIAALALQANHNAVMNATDQYNTAKTVTGMEEAAKLHPLPPISWGHPQLNGNTDPEKQMDDPAFRIVKGGRMAYDGSYLSGPTPTRRKTDNLRQNGPTVSNWNP